MMIDMPPMKPPQNVPDGSVATLCHSMFGISRAKNTTVNTAKA